MSKHKFTHIWTWLFAGFLISACIPRIAPTTIPVPSLPSTLAPLATALQPTPTPSFTSTMDPSPTPTPTPTSTFTFTPTPTFTPTSTSTFTPTSTLTPTPTVTPSPTNTFLPNVMDFDQALTFGGGGGQGNCIVSKDPPPAIYAFQNEEYSHMIALCAFDYPIPIGVPIHLSVSSTDGQYVLQDDFLINRDVSDGNGRYRKYWAGEYWWPLGLPAGYWQWKLSWDGGDAYGTFATGISSPEVSVLDSQAYSKLRATTYLFQCHSAGGSTGLTVAGRGFPANSNIYIPIYEQIGYTEYQPFYVQTTTTDGTGAFKMDLHGPFMSGKSYVVMGLSDPNAQYISAGNNLDRGVVGNAVDCFTVP